MKTCSFYVISEFSQRKNAMQTFTPYEHAY